jgi:hypothetical protein
MVAQSLYDYGDYTQVPVDTISNEYGITKSAIAKTWLNGQIVKIQSKITNNEIKPIEAFKELDTIHKSMATKENPNIWKNPEYVKSVNTAKASLITAITSNTTKQEKALENMREEKEAIFKIALTEAKTQEEKDNIILKAKAEAELGNIEWKNVIDVVDYSATKAVEKPSALQVSDVEYATLMYEARTNSDVTYGGVFELQVSGTITADQAKELNTLVKEKQALLRTLENEGKAESYKKATKLISTVTKQGIAIDPTLKAVTDNLMLTFMDRITAGEDPYKVANELVTNEPTLTKSIDKGKTLLIEDNPKYYMFREFGLESIKGGNLEKKATEIKKSNDLQQINNYKKALVTLHKNKSISYEDYRTAYMELNRGDN